MFEILKKQTALIFIWSFLSIASNLFELNAGVLVALLCFGAAAMNSYRSYFEMRDSVSQLSRTMIANAVSAAFWLGVVGTLAYGIRYIT
jgi:hypothetical protein